MISMNGFLDFFIAEQLRKAEQQLPWQQGLLMNVLLDLFLNKNNKQKQNNC